MLEWSQGDALTGHFICPGLQCSVLLLHLEKEEVSQHGAMLVIKIVLNCLWNVCLIVIGAKCNLYDAIFMSKSTIMFVWSA